MTALNHTAHNSVAENYYIKIASLDTRGKINIFQFVYMSTAHSQGAESPPQINTELNSAIISSRSVAT